MTWADVLVALEESRVAEEQDSAAKAADPYGLGSLRRAGSHHSPADLGPDHEEWDIPLDQLELINSDWVDLVQELDQLARVRPPRWNAPAILALECAQLDQFGFRVP